MSAERHRRVLRLQAENARLWAEEAQRRAETWDAGPLSSRPAEEVFREARARLMLGEVTRVHGERW